VTVPDERGAAGVVRAGQGHACDLHVPFVPEPYAFTDTEGRCGALFLAQRWVFIPMAGPIYNDRLICEVF
jgi:hypothetical protein